MNTDQIQKLKKGEWFQRIKPSTGKPYGPVLEKGKYCRTNKAWECTNIEDINDYRYIRKNTQVSIF